MPQTIGYVALVVRDYDEAIAYFTQKLGWLRRPSTIQWRG
jgi:catechol 2,3-dioxygenase-like lactoylglutathione lyase family enzyme